MCVFFAILILIPVWHSVCGQQIHGNGSSAAAGPPPPFSYDAPDDCVWTVRGDGDEVMLACTLRTINSEMDTTNFSAIPSEHTVSLLISCDPTVTAHSSMQNQSFAHLARLRELELDSCKLTVWPAYTLTGLHDLRNLTLRTGLSDWPDHADTTLEIAAGSFAHTGRLERLDLSTNNLAAVPVNTFCQLPNLVHLNLSRNRVQDVADLGFRERAPPPPPPPQPLIAGHDDDHVYDTDPYQRRSATASGPCPLDVRTVDVSWNRIGHLPTNGFGSLRRLAELRMAGNEIAVVNDRPLAGLASLEVLDMSCNRIVSLPVDMFKDVADTIKQIYLQNNSIGALTPALFVNLYQLTTLDLSFNQLTSDWIDASTFTGLIRLVTLNLSNNRITKLDPTMFHDLYTLQILNLGGNLIDSVPNDAFIPLRNLDTLVLSNNRIVEIGPLALNGLYALTLLSLDGNKLADVHEDCFKNCTTLQDLNLSGNVFRSVPAALREMRLLKTVDLGENRIDSIDPDSFYGMTNLYGLRLIGNRLRNLTSHLFDNLVSLQILNVAHNQIDYVAPDAFHNMTTIQAIRLDGNRLSSMERLFRNVTSLLWLNASDNVLNDFDYGMLPEQLEWLDVHKNYLTELSNRNGATVRIRTLDVRYNYLTYIGPSSVPDAVEILLMNDNQIMTVETSTFLAKVNVTRVDMYANQIGQLDVNALRLAPVPPDRPLPEFYIGGNPFQCDCKMEWLQRVHLLEALRQYPRVMDMGSIYCKLLYNRENRYVPLADIEPAQFVCTYKTHCFAVCQCCEFDACDCEMTCPVNCTCYHDQPWSSNIVDCYSSNYTQLPAKIPMDATEVYLDGNLFSHLSSHALLGRKNLRILFANHSGIRSVRNDTFTGLKRLAVLHLEHNAIERFDGSEFNTVENLRELYLQHNRIGYLNNMTFEQLRGLRVLRLDHNRLRDYDVWILSANARLADLRLADNPWSCECEFVQSFRRFMMTAVDVADAGQGPRVTDSAAVACHADDGAARDLSIRDQNATECRSFFGSIVENRIVRHVLPTALTAVCVVLALVLVLYLAVVYRHECRAWVYHKCGFRICHKTVPYEDDRMFDAYVAYSIKDDGFVAQMLAPGLEQGDPRYRVGLHYRDFNVSSFVADTIVEAIESSKRTILVVSKNFVESEWCRFEFKSALHEGLKDKHGRLIVVTLGEIQPKDVDPELRSYMKNAVHVNWGDRMFWEKLKFAMPDVIKCQSLISRSRNGVNIYATPLRTSYSFATQPPRTAADAASVQSSKYYLSPAYVDSSQHLWA
ncbi:toll-like receptor 6 isoform X1 [Sipha flava]|uniref:Toll-like receptor 6 isoform X1 n=2 Tax=Sipha flava TaxID=143950 RepID=A0A8B8GAL7_9HEMI|nr:toll-like receptor 6 isoform X1 [Sipha flava]